MAINFVYEKDDEELVKHLKTKIPKEFKNSSITVYIADLLESLQDIPTNKNANKTVIVITKNYSKEFVTCALEKTDSIVYKATDYELITKKLLSILEKRKK